MRLTTPFPTRVSLSINPSNQGLKPIAIMFCRIPGICVSIHQSIKSRVETMLGFDWRHWLLLSLSINPSNQGLKHLTDKDQIRSDLVSIHQSIKSRVETCLQPSPANILHLSLSINPSNQGLKRRDQARDWKLSWSLYPSIHQIKGWNTPASFSPASAAFVSIHQSIKSRVETRKQHTEKLHWRVVSIHQSIKSRVETGRQNASECHQGLSLSINPSNQGLKHELSVSATQFNSESLSINPSNQGLKHTWW